MVASDVMMDVDWCVTESVECAQPRSEPQQSRVDLSERVFRRSGALRIRMPLGRYGATQMDMYVACPCTRLDIMRAVYEFYQRPASHDHVRVLRTRAGESDKHIDRVEELLRSGERVPVYADFNGDQNTGFRGLRGDDASLTYDLLLGPSSLR